MIYRPLPKISHPEHHRLLHDGHPYYLGDQVIAEQGQSLLQAGVFQDPRAIKNFAMSS